MKVRWVLPCLLLCLLLLPGVSATSLEDLNRSPERWDGGRVTVRGEVVGRLDRGSHVWLNLWENGWSLGVWCPRELAEGIRVVGDHLHVGDRVEVTGIFRARCVEHGGEPDLHAENLLVLEEGHRIDRPLDLRLLALSLAVMAAALSLLLLPSLRRKEPFLGYSPESER